MADTGIKFDFKPLQQYSERLDQLDKYAKNLDKTLDGLQARQSILDKRFEEGSRTTQRMVDAFNREDRAAIAALRSTEKLNEVFSKAPASVSRFEASLKRTKQALEEVKASAEKVDVQKTIDNFADAGTKSGEGFSAGLKAALEKVSGVVDFKKVATGFVDVGVKAAEGFGRAFKGAFDRINLSGIVRTIGSKLQEGLGQTFPNLVKKSADILVNGFGGIATQIGRTFLGGLQAVGNGAVGIVQGFSNRISSAFQSVGQALAVGGLVGGLSVGAIAGASFNTIVEFDRAIINTQATTQQTNEEIAILREQLLEIGGNSRVGVEATANAFYDVASAVGDVNLQLPILESSILLAESGSDPVNELATATDGLVNVFNAYGLTADQATRVSDTFARSVQLGKGSLTEFVDAISSVSVVGANANVSFEELGAGIAFITARGASASEAATQLERATSALLRPNADLQVLLNQIGFESGSAALEALGLAGTLQTLFDATGGNVDQFAQALGSVEAFQAGLALADDSFNEFQTTFDEGLDGATLRSAEVQANSIAAQFDELNAALSRVKVILADAILPVVVPVVQGFTDFLQTIAQNNPEMIQFAAVLGAVAIALPVIAAAFTLILNPVTLLVAAVIALSSAFVDFSQSIPLLQEAASLVQDIGSALGLEPDVPTDSPTPQKPTDSLQNTAVASREEARLAAQTRTRLGTEQQIADVREESARQALDYTVEAGDTLSQVAADYGVSIEDLLAANPEITDPNLIFAGQTLTIPSELALEVDTSSVEESLKSAKDSVDALVDEGNPVSDVLNVSVVQEMRIKNIRGAIDDLKASLVDIFNTTRARLGENFGDLVEGIGLIASGDVSSGLVTVKNALADIITTVLRSGKNFGFAIIDFLGEVFGIDTEAAKAGLSSIIDPISSFIAAVKGATTEEFELIGTGLERLANVGELLQSGDISGAFKEFAGALGDIRSGLLGIGFDVLDNFLIFFENLTGIDTSGVRSGLQEVRRILDAFDDFKDAILEIFIGLPQQLGSTDLLTALSFLSSGDISTGLAWLNVALAQFVNIVLSTGQNFGFAIIDFLGEVFGIDTEAAKSGLSSIIDPISDLIWGLREATDSEFVQFGAGIETIISAAESLLKGDIGGALSGLGSGIADIAGGLVGIGFETLDQFLEFIEDVTGIDTTTLQTTVDNVRSVVDGLIETIESFASPILTAGGETIENVILPALSTLGTGLSTFIGQIGDLLQGDSVQQIASFFGQIFGLGLVFFGSISGSIMESLGENLPLLGQGITDIVDAVAAFLSGDVGSGLTLLATGLGNIYSAIISFGQDTTIGLLQAIQDVTGLDTTGLQQIAREIELILKNPLIAVQQFIYQLGEEITRFAVDLQIRLTEAILSIPGIDILLGAETVENLRASLAFFQDVRLEIDAATSAEKAINQALLADGVIDAGDLATDVKFNLQNANVVANIDPLTLANVREATQDALVAGTAEDALSNLTFASSIGIDISDQNFIISDERKAELSGLVASEIESILATAPENLTSQDLIRLDELINVSGELGLDLGELDLTTAIADFQTELSASLEDGSLSLSASNFLNASEIDFTQAVADMSVQGENVAQGFADGITNNSADASSAATSLGESAVESTANAVGSNSPATEFIAIGQFITEGLAIGIRNGFPAVSAVNGLLKNEMRSLGAEGTNNINALSNAYTRFAGVVQGASSKIIQALNAVKDALINFGTAAAGLALSVSVAENAVAGTGPSGNHTGGIVALATGGVVQTLSGSGMSENALYRAGTALSMVDHSAAYALVGERGREIATYDTSLFGLNNNLSRAYDFGYQQALRPTANISFVGTRGPELIRTRQSLAILNNQTTEAYLSGYRSSFQGGYQRGGIVHTEIPRLASGGILSPATFASLSGMGGMIINEDNSMDITIIVEGGANASADDVAETVQERMEDLLELRARQKKLRITRKM
jgi:TP901 family phage tail tape measure protein